MAGGAGDGREHTAACAFARSEYAIERQQRNDMPENGHREMSDAHTARSECMYTRVRRLVCVLCLRGAYTSPCAMWGVPGRGAPDGAWAWSSRRRTEATRIIWYKYIKLVRCKVFLGNLGSSTQAHHLRYHYKTTDGDARARPGVAAGWRLAGHVFGRFDFVRGPVRDPTASPPRSFSSWLSVYQRPQSPRACSPCIAFRRCSILKLCSTPASAGWSLPTSCE